MNKVGSHQSPDRETDIPFFSFPFMHSLVWLLFHALHGMPILSAYLQTALHYGCESATIFGEKMNECLFTSLLAHTHSRAAALER